MIYADTSALAKLIREEPDSAALRAWLSDWLGRRTVAEQLVAVNQVGVVELRRFAARVSQQHVSLTQQLIQRLQRIEVTPTAYALAGDVPPPAVRTLDALHIASAAELPGLTAFVTYDHRMAEAAAAFGLPVVAPS